MTTTNEIADKIAAEQNLTKAQAKTIVESVLSQIVDAAKSDAETSLPDQCCDVENGRSGAFSNAVAFCPRQGDG